MWWEVLNWSNSVTTFMPAEVLRRSVHMQNTASIILMKPKAEWFNYCINSSQLLNLLDPKWGKKGRFVKAVINLGFVFKKKKVSLVFQREGVCSGRLNMKIPERRGTDAQCTAISLSPVCGYKPPRTHHNASANQSQVVQQVSTMAASFHS